MTAVYKTYVPIFLAHLNMTIQNGMADGNTKKHRYPSKQNVPKIASDGGCSVNDGINNFDTPARPAFDDE
jgi:hypothetical protein